MKKKILVMVAAIAVLVTTLVVALPAHAAPGVLDHIQITPTSSTVPVGGPIQFLAQGYDDSNNSTAVQNFVWTVSGGGTIDSATGFFVAGNTTGKFTVQVSATQGSITKTATAQVKVSAVATTPTVTNLETRKLSGMLGPYLNSIGFSNFLSGQWQVKNGNGIDTIQAVAGVVQGVSNTVLTVLPNGQTTASSFVLTASTVILPNGIQLAVNDQVVVVTINGQVNMVVKITPATISGRGSCTGKRSAVRHGMFWGWSHGGRNNQNNNDVNDNED